jgi:hypothetical protein
MDERGTLTMSARELSRLEILGRVLAPGRPKPMLLGLEPGYVCSRVAARLQPSTLANALVIGLTAALFLTGPALANLRSEMFISNEIFGVPTMVPVIEGTVGPLQDSFGLDDPVPLPSGKLSVSTFVDYGILRLEAFDETFADAFASVVSDNGLRATGVFTDMLTIDAPGLAGTSGTLVAQVLFDGFLDADASGESLPFVSFSEAGAGLDFRMGSSSLMQRTRTCSTTVGNGPACLFGDPFGVQTFGPIAFTFGQPFPLSVSASAATFSRTVSSGSTLADADLRFTVEWRGIQSVSDALGDVPNFTVTSDSGVDWAQPVPEPEAARLAFAALMTLLWIRARRRGPGFVG